MAELNGRLRMVKPFFTVFTTTVGLVCAAMAYHLGIREIGMLLAIGFVAGGIQLLLVAGAYDWVAQSIAAREAEGKLESRQRMTWIEQGGIDLRAPQ